MNKQIEVMLSYRCDQACVFCSAWDMMRRHKGVRFPVRELARLLIDQRKKGYEVVNFTGGEPGLARELGPMLRLCRRLGYSTYVSTDGRALSESTLRYVDRLCVSLHGPTAEIHDHHTRSKGSFARLMRAMDRLKDRSDIYLMTNTVVTRRNLPVLDRTVALAESLSGTRLILISNLAPEAAGATHFSRIAARLNAIGRACGDLMTDRNGHSPVIRFFGIPLCVLGEYKAASNDLSYDPRLTIELDPASPKPRLKTTCFRRPDYLRVQTSTCRPCRYKSVCGGIFTPYLDRYGDSELKAL